mgnify:CR=1 FL=1
MNKKAQYEVLILETNDFNPTAWTNNPKDGILIGIDGPMDLKDAQEMARGFNEEEMKNKDNLWACVMPAKGKPSYKPYQKVIVQGQESLN